MLLLGFLSLCQVTFLPGYLCLRGFRLPATGLLRSAIYILALSLVANHTLVYALSSAGLYSAPIVYSIVAMEWLAVFYTMRRERFHFSVSLPSDGTLNRYRTFWRERPVLGRLIAFPAFAALLAAALLCYQYFGSVFVLNDDVLSWDRWAVEWATNRLPTTGIRQPGLYPQLLPANWSLTYVMLGNTDVKLFAKAIMPLFPLATLLLFLDLFHKTGRAAWLLGLSTYAFLLCFFFPPVFLASGYAEIPSAFFAFLTLHAFLQQDPGMSFAKPFLVAVFASGAALTKQGGVYIFALAFAWLVVHFARVRSWRAPVLVLALVLLVNWRWVVTEWRVARGQTSTNMAYLTQEIHAGKTYAQRWQSSWRMIENARGAASRPLVLLVASGVLLSVLHPQGRMVFLVILAPFYVLWSLFFSYETRTLAIGLPFAACCFASGAEVAAGFCRRSVRITVSKFRRTATPVIPAPANPVSRKAAKRAGRVAKPTSTPRPSRRLPVWLWLGSGLLAALVLWRSAQSAWLVELAAAWRGPLAAGCVLAILAPSLVDRLSPLRVRLWAPALLLACAGAIAVAQTALWPSGALVRDQLEKRKIAGSPSLNQKLYEYAQRKPLAGKILTDNFFLEVLPELNQYQRYLSLPRPATPEFLEDLLTDPEVRYILGYHPVFPATLRVWMAERGFGHVFDEQGYMFFELPKNRPYPGIRIFSAQFELPSGGTVMGELQGFRFQNGDRVAVNGTEYPSVFGTERNLTFRMPSTLLAGPLLVELLRPGSGERSRPYRVVR